MVQIKQCAPAYVQNQDLWPIIWMRSLDRALSNFSCAAAKCRALSDFKNSVSLSQLKLKIKWKDQLNSSKGLVGRYKIRSSQLTWWFLIINTPVWRRTGSWQIIIKAVFEFSITKFGYSNVRLTNSNIMIMFLITFQESRSFRLDKDKPSILSCTHWSMHWKSLN